MKLIKETSRRIIQFIGYEGVCDNCGGLLEYSDDLMGIEIFEDTEANYIIPIDALKCPHCLRAIEMMRRWKSLEVTAEFQEHK